MHDGTGAQEHTEEYAYQYDNWGRLLLTAHRLDGSAALKLAENTYDSVGRLSGASRGGTAVLANPVGLASSYTYNVRGGLTGINSPWFSETLTYETPRSGSRQPGQWGGNISSSQWRTSMSSSDWKWYDYGYDMLGRLAEAWFGEAEAASSVDYKLAYEYDLNGNLERRTSLNNAWAIENHERETRWMWSQADGNRPAGWSQERYGVTLLSGTPSRPPQRIYQLDPSGSQGENYSYDSSGNRTATLSAQGDTLSAMRYNRLHLPTEFTTAAGDTVNYVYSADGEKLYVEENPSGGTVQGTEYAANYRIENGTVTMIHTDAGYYTPYPASSGGTGASYRHIWYLKDHLGNNRALVDGSGALVALHDYDPFGEEIATASSSQLSPIPPGAKNSPYKYGGKEWSATTSTYDFEARQFSPSFHRFTTMDPLAEKYYSISPYAYCADDPVNLVDPDGHLPHVVGGAVIGGLVGGGIALIEGKSGKDFWGAVAGGAVTGAVVAASGGTALLGESIGMAAGRGFIAGATGAMLGSITNQGFIEGSISAKETVVNGLAGAVGWAVTGEIGAAVKQVEQAALKSVSRHYSSKQTVNAVHNQVKNDIQKAGHTAGYRNKALIDKTVAETLETHKTIDRGLVKATATVIDEVQSNVIGYKLEELSEYLYER